jgi:glutamate-1-semialdehyde 2,1-aminomutase
MMPGTLAATTVLPFNDAAAVEAALAAGDVAAVIVEPIPHNIGCVLPEPGFLEAVQASCAKHGTIFVLDEVITGFRHAPGGYQELAGLRPDLTTLGKAMANGYPIGALGGRRDLMEEFSTTPGRRAFFAGTYNGHPGCAAAALATIDKLQREPVHEHVRRLGDLARARLTEVFAGADEPWTVTGFGSVFVAYAQDGPIRDYRDLLRNDVERFVGQRRRQMEHGIFELPLNLKRSHLSYAHTEAHVDRLGEAAAAALAAA